MGRESHSAVEGIDTDGWIWMRKILCQGFHQTILDNFLHTITVKSKKVTGERNLKLQTLESFAVQMQCNLRISDLQDGLCCCYSQIYAIGQEEPKEILVHFLFILIGCHWTEFLNVLFLFA